MPHSPGMRWHKGLKVKMDELQWWTFEENERFRDFIRAESAQLGLVVDVVFGNEHAEAWRVHDDNDDGTITITAGGEDPAIAYDDEAYPIMLEAESDVGATDDNTWYTLVMSRAAELYERGTLTFATASKSATGAGTECTRYHGLTTDAVAGVVDAGTVIRVVGSSNGNDGDYEIDVVTDDLNIVLKTAALGTNESGLTFQVIGKFSIAVPADPVIHQRTKPVFTLVAKTTIPAAGQLILADVKRNDAGAPPKVIIIDRRRANMHRWKPAYRVASWLEQRVSHHQAAGPDYITTKLKRAVAYAPATASNGFDIAPGTGTVRFVAVATRATAADIVTFTQAATGAWATAGTVIAGGSNLDAVCIEKLPANHPNGTHICVYLKAVVAYYKFSTDNGTTWGAEIGPIWDPTAIAAGDQLFDPDILLTRRGRLILTAMYNDVSEAAGSQRGLRYIYSDDYGSNWVINTHNGFKITDALANTAEAEAPRMAQDADGTIWTAYKEVNPTADTKIRVILSSSENTPAAATTAEGGTVGEVATATKYGLGIWASPAGGVNIFWGDDDATDGYYAQAFLSKTSDGLGALSAPAEVMRDTQWLKVDHVGHVAGNSRIRVAQGRSGFAMVLFHDTKAANDAVDAVECKPLLMPLAPGIRLD